MDVKYLEEIKAAKKALNEEIRFYKHEQKELNAQLSMDAQDSYSSGHSDAVVHIDQQIDGLNSALRLITEVELSEKANAIGAKQNDELMDKLEDADQQIDTLKKALTRACEEVTKHTDECPASLYNAEMCKNCNDDDCDSNRADLWRDYFVRQAQKQEAEKK